MLLLTRTAHATPIQRSLSTHLTTLFVFIDIWLVILFTSRGCLERYEPPHDKTNAVTVRSAKSRGIRQVWSESLLCDQWIATCKDHSFRHVDSEDSDQTGRIRLIWVFAARTLILLVLSCLGSYCFTTIFLTFIVEVKQRRSWNVERAIFIIEPRHDKTNKLTSVPSEDSEQSGHPPSLIRVFAVRMKKAWVLSYPLSTQRRHWLDWADAQADLSLRWAHSHFVGFVM